MLRDALIKRGVKIDGRLRTVNARSGGSIVPDASNRHRQRVPAPSHRSKSPACRLGPFNLIAAHTLKPSQNLYTELILRTLGKMRKSAPPPNETRRERLTKMRDSRRCVIFLSRPVSARAKSDLDDGSGLSRSDMIMADATVQLLTFMTKHRYFAQFRDALPIAGVDGTLRNRMRGTPAERNVRAKTGTLSSVASLGGYVTTAVGRASRVFDDAEQLSGRIGVATRFNRRDRGAAGVV